MFCIICKHIYFWQGEASCQRGRSFVWWDLKVSFSGFTVRWKSCSFKFCIHHLTRVALFMAGGTENVVWVWDTSNTQSFFWAEVLHQKIIDFVPSLVQDTFCSKTMLVFLFLKRKLYFAAPLLLSLFHLLFSCRSGLLSMWFILCVRYSSRDYFLCDRKFCWDYYCAFWDSYWEARPCKFIHIPGWLHCVCRRRFAESGAVAAPQINVITMPLPYKELSSAAAINGWTPATQTVAPAPISDPSSSQPPAANNSLSDYVGMLKGSLNRAKQRLSSQPGTRPEDAKGKKAQLQGMTGDLAISPPGILDSSSIRMKQDNSESKWPSKALEKPVHLNTDNVGARSIDESTYGFRIVPPVTQISDSSGGAPNVGLGNSNERMCTSTQAHLVGRNKSLKRGNAEMDHILAEPISMSDLGLCSRDTTCFLCWWKSTISKNAVLAG